MAQEVDELIEWCTKCGLLGISDRLKEFAETLEDLAMAEDEDIAEIIKGLRLTKMKDKLKFKKAVKALKAANNAKDAPTAVANNNSKQASEPGLVLSAANNNDSKEDSEEKEFEGFVLKPDMPIKSGVYIIPTIKKKDINGLWKTIMVIGETGSGKSTTLNSMINYLWNVSLDDHYRFVLIPPPANKSDQGKSVTSEVTSYHFKPPNLHYGLTVVDTPGFGDTKGMKTDQEIVRRIEKAFKNDFDTIDAVFFVLKASQARLTAMQTYVFNAMLRVFGKDIASNLFLLITFCDGDDPPVYASVRAYQLPYKTAFELNNSAFFTGFQDYFEKNQVKYLDLQKDSLKLLSKKQQLNWMKNKPAPKVLRKVTKNFWEMGIDAMENLFQVLGETRAKSLKLSRQVLDLRNHLQIRIKSLHDRITEGLNLISNIRQIIDTIKIHAKDVNSSKGFKISVTATRLVNVPTPNNVTTCSNCKFTCHKNCSYSDNADKRYCGAMDKSYYCGVCPGKCWWNCHTNEHYFLESESYTKTVTKTELKKKFDESTKGMTFAEQTVISQTHQIISLQGEVVQNIREVRSCIETLGEIALKPCVMEEDEYYELMIQSEEEQKEPNYRARVKAIKQLREQAKQVRILQNKQFIGTETGQLFDTQLKQLQKDLSELKQIQGDAPEAASRSINNVAKCIISTQSTFTKKQTAQKKANERSKKNLLQMGMDALPPRMQKLIPHGPAYPCIY